MDLPLLNFPEKYQFRLKQSGDSVFIFCPLRKKWLVLTPEEWVRQHMISFLTENKSYPKSAMASEVPVILNKMTKRADLIVYRKQFPHIVVECKAPSIPITQETFDQIARYNMELAADYLIVSNGLHHYYCQMDYENRSYIFLKSIPDYNPGTP